jgi:hypothetical protein
MMARLGVLITFRKKGGYEGSLPLPCNWNDGIVAQWNPGFHSYIKPVSSPAFKVDPTSGFFK